MCNDVLERGYSPNSKSHFWRHSYTGNSAKPYYDDRAGKPVIDAKACPGCENPIKRLKSKAKEKGYFWVHINPEDATTCQKILGDEKGKPILKNKG